MLLEFPPLPGFPQIDELSTQLSLKFVDLKKARKPALAGLSAFLSVSQFLGLSAFLNVSWFLSVSQRFSIS